MRGFCEVLKQENMGALNASQLEVLDQVGRQVELQERMVDDLLDLARMEKGKLSIHPTLTSLTDLLRDEVDKSQMEARERNISLSLTMAIAPSLTTLQMDGSRIRQVVWNLIHNALKFTSEEGRILVRAS